MKVVRWLFVATVFDVHHAAIIHPPANTISQVNDSVQLTCTFNGTSPIRWERLSSQSNHLEIIHNGNRMTDELTSRDYSVRTAGDTSWLMINATRVDDAGVFACLQTGKSQKFAAELFVLAYNDNGTPVIHGPDKQVFQGADATSVSCTRAAVENREKVTASCPPTSPLYRLTLPRLSEESGKAARGGTTFSCSVRMNLGANDCQRWPCVEPSPCASNRLVTCSDNVPVTTGECHQSFTNVTGVISDQELREDADSANENNSPTMLLVYILAPAAGVVVVVLLLIAGGFICRSQQCCNQGDKPPWYEEIDLPVTEQVLAPPVPLVYTELDNPRRSATSVPPQPVPGDDSETVRPGTVEVGHKRSCPEYENVRTRTRRNIVGSVRR